MESDVYKIRTITAAKERYQLVPGDANALAEKEYATAKIIKFTYLDSCIGVVGRKGDDLTGVHLVLDIEKLNEQADNVAQQIVDLLQRSDEVIIVGLIELWENDNMVLGAYAIVQTLKQKLNATLHTWSESGYWVVGPWREDKPLMECAQLTLLKINCKKCGNKFYPYPTQPDGHISYKCPKCNEINNRTNEVKDSERKIIQLLEGGLDGS